MDATNNWPWLLIFAVTMAVACIAALAATAYFIWRVQRQSNRVTYDALGVERADVPCRMAGCIRGAAGLSVFCKRHHFEKNLKSRCPFRD